MLELTLITTHIHTPQASSPVRGESETADSQGLGRSCSQPCLYIGYDTCVSERDIVVCAEGEEVGTTEFSKHLILGMKSSCKV